MSTFARTHFLEGRNKKFADRTDATKKNREHIRLLEQNVHWSIKFSTPTPHHKMGIQFVSKTVTARLTEL